MSCNGCRVLRKGCSDACVLRPCLQWIDSPDAQGRATVFVAKFFGRAALMSFINAVPEIQRPSLFRSLLYEACGRTVNPVTGAVGLLSSGNWHACQAAVDTVFAGGSPELLLVPHQQEDQSDAEVTFAGGGEPCRSSTSAYLDLCLQSYSPATSPSGNSSDSVTTCLEIEGCVVRSKEARLLNLFN